MIECDYIMRGDCLELMEAIPMGSIDMILCDLPYGTTRNKWDSIIPFDRLWEQYERIIKNNGAIVLFSQMPFAARLICSNIKLFRYEWVWEKDNSTGFLNAKKMPLKIHENICVFYKNPPTYNPQMRKGFKPYVVQNARGSTNYGKQQNVTTVSNGERYPVDLIKFTRDKSKVHPTQKPVALLEYLIKTYTNEGEIVLDNCMGSGSTCVAAVNTNRHYIGFELEEKYFSIACKRLDEAENCTSINFTNNEIVV